VNHKEKKSKPAYLVWAKSPGKPVRANQSDVVSCHLLFTNCFHQSLFSTVSAHSLPPKRWYSHYPVAWYHTDFWIPKKPQLFRSLYSSFVCQLLNNWLKITNNWRDESHKPSLARTHEDFPSELQKNGSQVRLKTNTVSALKDISDSDLKPKHEWDDWIGIPL